TIDSMGTSLVSWTRALLERRLFAADACVLGLTSEGNTVAWKGYAAVAAAKTALESVARAIAVELAPYGVRANVVQAGITDTPALRAIPGHAHLAAPARRRNPFGRLRTPRVVAHVIFLLATAVSQLGTGALIRVDCVAHALGIEAPCLDVNSACTSFFAQLHVLTLMRPEALPPFVLLVVSEAVTRAVDYTDRASAVLWGDGAIAAVVSTTVPARARIVATTFTSSPEGAGRVVVPRTGHFR